MKELFNVRLMDTQVLTIRHALESVLYDTDEDPGEFVLGASDHIRSVLEVLPEVRPDTEDHVYLND